MLGSLGSIVFRISHLWTTNIHKDSTRTGRKFPWISTITFLVLYWGAYIALLYIGVSEFYGVPFNTNTTSMGITLLAGIWVSTNSVLVPFIVRDLSPKKFLIWMGFMSILITAIMMMTFYPHFSVAS